MNTLSNIKLHVFDVDGTLYKSFPQINEGLYNYCIDWLSKEKQIDTKTAKILFEKTVKKTKSKTLALSILGLGTAEEVIAKAEKDFYIPTTKEYLQNDQKLVQMVDNLHTKYLLGTLRNGTYPATISRLELIGFTKYHSGILGDRIPKPFDYIFKTVELGSPKPDALPFNTIMQITKLHSEEVLMIGDRIEIDLIPAKKLGMKTCLVTWGKPPDKKDDKFVDYTVETVYEVNTLVN